MSPWIIFIVGILLLAMVVFGGFLLKHERKPGASDENKIAEDARFLYLLLGLASLSILAYIAFTFGIR
jgi:heme/copper-type cytochrome/quinol oxidase subunit 2